MNHPLTKLTEETSKVTKDQMSTVSFTIFAVAIWLYTACRILSFGFSFYVSSLRLYDFASIPLFLDYCQMPNYMAE